jgi:hypothetical protein
MPPGLPPCTVSKHSRKTQGNIQVYAQSHVLTVPSGMLRVAESGDLFSASDMTPTYCTAAQHTAGLIEQCSPNLLPTASPTPKIPAPLYENPLNSRTQRGIP